MASSTLSSPSGSWSGLEMKTVEGSIRRYRMPCFPGAEDVVSSRPSSRGSCSELGPMYTEWVVLCRPSVLLSSDAGDSGAGGEAAAVDMVVVRALWFIMAVYSPVESPSLSSISAAAVQSTSDPIAKPVVRDPAGGAASTWRLGRLRRCGCSKKVHGCWWKAHRKHFSFPGSLTQRSLRLRQMSQGRSEALEAAVVLRRFAGRCWEESLSVAAWGSRGCCASLAIASRGRVLLSIVVLIMMETCCGMAQSTTSPIGRGAEEPAACTSLG